MCIREVRDAAAPKHIACFLQAWGHSRTTFHQNPRFSSKLAFSNAFSCAISMISRLHSPILEERNRYLLHRLVLT
ncbi:hypothetical protein ACFOGG_04410 [Brenneria rubrifaciens]|uniref:hypothetical protein n=1 Tax=Brenneria rubrifaciens TaxID=55213 RepID=UPI00360B8D92